MDEIPDSPEAARDELAAIEKWLTEVQAALPQHQARGLWLRGYIAAHDRLASDQR